MDASVLSGWTRILFTCKRRKDGREAESIEVVRCVNFAPPQVAPESMVFMINHSPMILTSTRFLRLPSNSP
jgi:hypothetical protein